MTAPPTPNGRERARPRGAADSVLPSRSFWSSTGRGVRRPPPGQLGVSSRGPVPPREAPATPGGGASQGHSQATWTGAGRGPPAGSACLSLQVLGCSGGRGGGPQAQPNRRLATRPLGPEASAPRPELALILLRFTDHPRRGTLFGDDGGDTGVSWRRAPALSGAGTHGPRSDPDRTGPTSWSLTHGVRRPARARCGRSRLAASGRLSWPLPSGPGPPIQIRAPRPALPGAAGRPDCASSPLCRPPPKPEVPPTAERSVLARKAMATSSDAHPEPPPAGGPALPQERCMLPPARRGYARRGPARPPSQASCPGRGTGVPGPLLCTHRPSQRHQGPPLTRAPGTRMAR